MRFGILSLAIVIACFALPAQSGPHRSHICLNGLVPTLVDGNFSGSINCERDRLTARFVGQIALSGHQITIYDYHYQLAPACPECAVHGGQRVIFLRDGRYIGQYKPESVTVEIDHGELVLTPKGDLGLVGLSRKEAEPISVPLQADGPPPTVWVGGENLGFFR
jgi:hypothetical protein